MRRAILTAGLIAGAGLIWLAVRCDTRPVLAQSGYTVTWEAEAAQKLEAPFKKRVGVKSDKRPKPQRNSGDGYIEIPDKANGDKKEGEGSELPGLALYRVNVPAAGQYQLYGRVYWPNGCGNSFYVRKEGRTKQRLGEDGTYDAWHWVPLDQPKLTLSKGVNVIEVLNREDGVLLDEIQITTGTRVPTGAVSATPGALAD